MLSRDQWIAYRKSQRAPLVAKRRKVDERYDPAKAIMAQTRYLVGLTRRYGGVDWALQAYHGGEAGASTRRHEAERRETSTTATTPDRSANIPRS